MDRYTICDRPSTYFVGNLFSVVIHLSRSTASKLLTAYNGLYNCNIMVTGTAQVKVGRTDFPPDGFPTSYLLAYSDFPTGHLLVTCLGIKFKQWIYSQYSPK